MNQEELNKKIEKDEEKSYDLILLYIALFGLEINKIDKKTIQKLTSFYSKYGTDITGNRRVVKALEKEISQFAIELNVLEKNKIEEMFMKIAKTNYATATTMFGKTDIDMSALVSKFMKTPWAKDGLTYLDRINASTAKMASEIKSEFRRALLRDDDLTTLEKAIQKKFKTFEHEMNRLYSTEGSALRSYINKELFKANGFEEFIFLAIIDDRTSDICRSMNKRVFYISDWLIGVTVPPLHPNCRSSVAPYLNGKPLEEFINK